MTHETNRRTNWAKRNAKNLVDGILGCERSEWPCHPSEDQIALLREIARLTLWHMPNSGDEVRALVRYFEVK